MCKNDVSVLGRCEHQHTDCVGRVSPHGATALAWQRLIHGACRLMPVVVACLAAMCMLNTGANAASESQVKAAFIYNFARFLEWPAQSFPSSDTPVTIGVVGSEQIGNAIERITKGKTINGRKLVVKRLGSGDNFDSCHVLFISASERRRTKGILERLRDSSVLTIGETDGFIQNGGVIGFVIENNKIAFEINTGAAKKKRLIVSSQLLKLARNVRD